MRFNLRLIHKLLILVAVPLVFELVFGAFLLDVLRQAEEAGAREHRAREAVASLNSIYDRITETSRMVGTAVLRKNGAPAALDFHQMTATIPGDLTNLKDQLADDPAAIQDADKLEQTLNASLRILDEVFSQLEAGERLPALQHLRDLRGAIPDLVTRLNDLRQRCSRIADDNFEQDRRQRKNLRGVILYGLAVNFAIAAGLVLFINRNVTSRLAVVMENTRRLSKRQELLPQVSGGDEIAHLDKVFKDMAMALEMAHQKERAIIDTMPAGLVIADSTGLIQMINPTMSRFLHFQSDELNGLPVVSILHSEKKEGADREIFEELIAKATDRTDERSVKRKNGEIFPVELSVTSFTVFSNQYWLLVMLDITERKEIERLKQEFVSMVSHDLRTPLTSIQVFLNMLARGLFGQVPENVLKKATMADRNASRLINLINDLLDIEKMESGQLSLACENTTIQSVIERSVESVRAFAEQHGIAIESGGTADAQLYADGDRLVQVMVNLLGNAVKFSPRGTAVSVAALEEEDGFLTVKVIDHGRGIPGHLRQTIFERFKQVEAKDSTEKKGTGLGLAICKAIVEQHGGTIGVESEPGEGSTFWFKLPTVKNMIPLAASTKA